MDELPDPTNGSYTNGSMSYDTLQKNSAQSIGGGNGTNTIMNGKSLLEGQYDEAQSHQEFLDALNAWRTGSAKTTTTKKF